MFLLQCGPVPLLPCVCVHVCVLHAGYLLTFLTKLPLLGAACGGKLAYLSALLEATVVGHSEEASAAVCVRVGSAAITYIHNEHISS